MSTDSQGRPLSDDGQWAWSGTEWVPAAQDASPPEPEDVGSTRVIQSPFTNKPAGGETFVGSPPSAAPGGPPAGGTPGYVGSTPGYVGSTPGGTPGSPPGKDPGWAAVPPAPKTSRRTLILVIVGVLVVVAVVLILIFTLGGSSKKGPTGAFNCTSPNLSGTGVITFTTSTNYTLNMGGKGGNYSYANNKLLFTSGSLANTTSTFRSGAKTFNLTYQGQNLTCKKQ